MLTGSTIAGIVNVNGVTQIWHNVLGDGIETATTGEVQFSGISRLMCFHNPLACVNGFTLGIVIHITNQASTTKNYLSNGGGQINSDHGLKLSLVSGRLTAIVQVYTTETLKWEADIAVVCNLIHFPSLLKA